MSKVAFFGHISPNFFDDLFFRKPPKFFKYPQNFLPPKNFPASPNFFYPFRPENSFFRLFRPKKSFLALKNFFFRPKNFFLDLKIFFRLFKPKNPFLDLKMFSNRLNSLQKHLLNLQSDEKNYIFNFSIYSKKLPYS